MAQTSCWKCGQTITDEAAPCPGCGGTVKRSPSEPFASAGGWGCILLSALVLIGVIGAMLAGSGESRTARNAEPVQSPEEIRLYGIRPVRSSLDGSYPEVEAFLRRNMNDPSSLKFVGCTDAKLDQPLDGWITHCEYRGKNAFGALVLNRSSFLIRGGRALPL